MEDVQRLITSLTNYMGDCLQDEISISISELGTFETKKRLERIIINPATKERMLVPPKLVLNFKPTAAIKEKLKNGDK